MYRIAFFILALFTGITDARPGIPPWDALPAVDVMHLQGPYAGTTVCPMCRHGYDAGLLVFLPSTTSPTSARHIANALRETATSIDDPRFRPFLVLTGAMPSPKLLQAVRAPSTNWYVANLSDDALAKASTDFQENLAAQPVGYVFAQRRMLWRFDPTEPDSMWQRDLDSFSRYAMQFLHANYEVPVATHDMDVPKGNLWAAPNHLSSTAGLGRSGEEFVKACVPTSERVIGTRSLIALNRNRSARGDGVAWVTTDENGCVQLSGTRRDDGVVPARVFRSLQPVMDARIDLGSRGLDDVATIQPDRPTRSTVTGSERIVGLPCEGCDSVFSGIPSTIESSSDIVGPSEAGERMTVSGVVTDQAGMSQPGIIVYAYQTDASGAYPANPDLVGSAARHGRLRAWARTDPAGRYQFQTIRPGPYPGRTTPQHIHLHIIEPGRCNYYIGDLMFNDDPRMTAAIRKHEQSAYGGSGVVGPVGDATTGWQAIRNIRLGLNVPDYAGCSTDRAVITGGKE